MDPKINIFQSSMCPGTDALKAYRNGNLAADQIRFVELHIADCEMCADELEGMSQLSDTEIEKNINLIKSKTNQLLFEETGRTIHLFKKLMVAASVLLIWSLMFMFQHTIEPTKPLRLADVDQKHEDKQEKIKLNPAAIHETESEREPVEPQNQQKGSEPASVSPMKETTLLAPTSLQRIASTDANATDSEIAEANKADINYEKGKLDETDDKLISINKEEHEAVKDNKKAKTGNPTNVYGLVRDPNGISLPGVTVQIKGTTNAVITDIDGKFSLDTKGAKDPVLVFRFIGYDAQEQKLPKNPAENMNITLFEEAIALDEVVVVGYGTNKKKALATNPIARIFKKVKTENATKPVDPKQEIADALLKAKRFETLNIDSALSYYKKVVSIEPKHVKTQLSIVYCYVKAQRIAMAEFKIAELLKLKSFEPLKPNLLKVKTLIEEEEDNKALLLLNQMRH